VINTRWVKVFFTWPWSVDRRLWGSPIGLRIHTKRHYFDWRPIWRKGEGFAQGGDVRGMADLHDYRKECSWMLDHQDPEIWERLDDLRLMRRDIRRSTSKRC